MAKSNRRPSHRLTEDDAVAIIEMHLDGHFQNRIAAVFDVNPGRVSEIVNRKRFPNAWKRLGK